MPQRRTRLRPSDLLVETTRRALATLATCNDTVSALDVIRRGDRPVVSFVMRTGGEFAVVAADPAVLDLAPGCQLVDAHVGDDGHGELTFGVGRGVVAVRFSRLRVL